MFHAFVKCATSVVECMDSMVTITAECALIIFRVSVASPMFVKSALRGLFVRFGLIWMYDDCLGFVSSA